MASAPEPKAPCLIFRHGLPRGPKASGADLSLAFPPYIPVRNPANAASAAILRTILEQKIQ